MGCGFCRGYSATDEEKDKWKTLYEYLKNDSWYSMNIKYTSKKVELTEFYPIVSVCKLFGFKTNQTTLLLKVKKKYM